MARRSSSPRRYAEAAYEIALRDDTVDAWRAALQQVAATVSDESVARSMSNPSIPRERRAAALEAAIAGGPPQVRNLVILLLRRGRIESAPLVAQEFQRLDERRRGIVRATVTSAAPLQDDEAEAIRSRLGELTGRTVEPTFRVDPDLLGGVVVRIGDTMIDGSLRGRLERLRTRLVAAAR